MEPNPYEPPSEQAKLEGRSGSRRIAAYVIGWCLFFLLPTLTLVLAIYFPHIFGLARLPDRDGVLIRISLTVASRADIALPISFVGCAVISAISPVRAPWKIAIVLAWFPLSLVQLFAMILGLYAATGYMYT